MRKRFLAALIICLFSLIGFCACSGCGMSLKLEETECQHVEVVDMAVAPTCNKTGLTEGKHCEKCGAVFVAQQEVPMTEHVYITEVVSPTCYEEGYTRRACTGCGAETRENYVDKLTHRFYGGDCLHCSEPEILEPITPATEWYNSAMRRIPIDTKEQLAGIAALVNAGEDFTDKTILLAKDIDLGWYEWIPIGTEEHPFNGTFDGAGFTISSLKINSMSPYLGLFGKVSGKIGNFTIKDASIYSVDISQYIGVACGYSTNDISNVKVNGYIDTLAAQYVGGIVGYTTAQISDVSSKTEIHADKYVGGIAGYINPTTAMYQKLTNEGNIFGGAYTAGIVGYAVSDYVVDVKECYNVGAVTGTTHVAGLFGYFSAKSGTAITASASLADVTGEYYVGGVAGEVVNVLITGCANEGSTITATSYFIEGENYYAYVGGYVGKGHAIEYCANHSNINYTSRGMYVGGVAGYVSTVKECVNHGNVNGYDCVGGVAGHISASGAQMLSNINNTGNIKGKAYVGGFVGEWIYNNTFVLEFCINSGNVEGTHHVGGMVGFLNGNGQLLTARELENTGNVTASEEIVGGLFGYISTNTSSVISNSKSSAAIQGLYYVGGLIGYTENTTLKNCSNENSTVTATGFFVDGTENYVFLGGYVGRGYSVVGATNDVDIDYQYLGQRIGGIAGLISYNLIDCTNNGNITSLAGGLGGIAGEINSNQLLACENLTNNGNIQGLGNNIGGIAGKISNITNTKGTYAYRESSSTWHIGYHYYSTSKLTNMVNNGDISGQSYAAGLIGYAYFESVFYREEKGTPNYYYHGHLGMEASNLTNNGEVVGSENVAELMGYFDADYASTLTDYTILGHVTQNNAVLEGEYTIWEKHDITISNRIYPEAEAAV